MTVLTTAILEEEKKEKADEETGDATVPVIVKTTIKPVPVARNRRSLHQSPYRIFLFIITLIGLLCALGGLCYGIYHFAKLGHMNRHRVFCRVIEASPIRRTRIVAEKAHISKDGHAVQLFVPSFLHQRQLFTSSVVLILDDHDIIVFKVESHRKCFVRQQMPNRRPRVHEPHALFHWFHHIEEGGYFPRLSILRRKWLAHPRSMSPLEAGRRYHPKVATFCKEMRVFRIVEYRERIGVIPFGGGLLPACPLRKCATPCPGNRFRRDRHGCKTCKCASEPRRRCPEVMCALFCPYGKATDPLGCPLCACKTKPRVVVQRRVVVKRAAGAQPACPVLHLATGLNPLPAAQGSFELDDIKMC